MLSMERTVLAAVCILPFILQCQGYRGYLSTNLGICESLDVQHGSVEEVSHETVKVVLTDSMKRESTCFKPRKTYNGKQDKKKDHITVYHYSAWRNSFYCEFFYYSSQ